MDGKRYYNIITFLSMSFLAVVYWFLFDFLRWDMFDSPSFVAAARQMFGLEGGYNFQSRLSKPLVLILPGALEYFTSIEAQWGFIFQTVVAFFGCGFLINRIIFNLTNRRDFGLYGMLIYLFSQPFAIFSLMILVDAPGWFLSLIIIDRAIILVKKQTITIFHWMALSALSAIGLLVKESVVFSFIFIIFYQYYVNINVKNKIIGVIVSCCVFVALFLVTQIITHYTFQDSIIMRVFSQQERVGFVYYDLHGVLQLFRTFDLYWLLFVLGVLAIKSALKKYPIKKEILAFVWATILSIIIMPVWPYIIDRILFMIAPALVVFAVLSEHYLKKSLFPLIIIGGIFNIMGSWLIYKHNIGGLLLSFLLLYAFLLIYALVVNKKKYQSEGT